jgi:hypothetical protein
MARQTRYVVGEDWTTPQSSKPQWAWVRLGGYTDRHGRVIETDWHWTPVRKDATRFTREEALAFAQEQTRRLDRIYGHGEIRFRVVPATGGMPVGS